MNYRITSPLRQATQILPETLQESDFVRWGRVTHYVSSEPRFGGQDCSSVLGPKNNENGTSHQNAKLLTPITIIREGKEHIYPKNAYIRIYSYGSVHLISKHPLP
jgi:hypothetical protein